MTSKHWNEIFSTKKDSELGWYENDISQTLKFFDLISCDEHTKILLPGAGTSTLVDYLLEKKYKLILNDISNEALSKLKIRIGDNEHLKWLCHDISKPLPNDIPRVDIWIDRAVLHFLLEDRDIQGYFDNLYSKVCSRGYVLLAEFSTTGAPKCAGLELHRYSIEELIEYMGKEFELIKYENYTFINPFGDPRPYIYALFQRNG